jgi:hypothetical protein
VKADHLPSLLALIASVLDALGFRCSLVLMFFDPDFLRPAGYIWSRAGWFLDKNGVQLASKTSTVGT